jgi:hypothetical protein
MLSPVGLSGQIVLRKSVTVGVEINRIGGTIPDVKSYFHVLD